MGFSNNLKFQTRKSFQSSIFSWVLYPETASTLYNNQIILKKAFSSLSFWSSHDVTSNDNNRLIFSCPIWMPKKGADFERYATKKATFVVRGSLIFVTHEWLWHWHLLRFHFPQYFMNNFHSKSLNSSAKFIRKLLLCPFFIRKTPFIVMLTQSLPASKCLFLDRNEQSIPWRTRMKIPFKENILSDF